MAWKKTENIILSHLSRHGLGPAIIATNIGQEAEKMYPELFRSISFKGGYLHLEVPRKKLLSFKMVQGKLLKDLNVYCKDRSFPVINDIRLTIIDD